MLKTLVLALLAAVSMASCGDVDPQIPSRLTKDALDEVCVALSRAYEQVDCSDLKPPILIPTKIPSLVTSIGLYVNGEPYVFINYAHPKRTQALVHETIHYVIYELKLDSDRCEIERIARVLTNDDNATWRERYRCPLDTEQ